MLRLHTFPGLIEPANLMIHADFWVRSEGLFVRWEWQDKDSVLLWPGTPAPPRPGVWDASTAARTDGLWKHTCFEAFWSVPETLTYWELNVSTGGAWALYSFDDYRSPQPPRASSTFLLERLEVGAGFVSAHLKPEGTPFVSVDVGLTAVTELATDSSLHYFSSSHAGAKPDFHLRTGFNLHRALEAGT